MAEANETMEQAVLRFDKQVREILDSIKILDQSGEQLDRTAANYGLKRHPAKHWYWPFPESDRKLRGKICDLLRGTKT